MSVRCSDEELQDRHFLLAVDEQDFLVCDLDAAVLFTQLVDRPAAPRVLAGATRLHQYEIRVDGGFFASPLDFEKTKVEFRRHAPRIGGDGEEVLREAGVSDSEIDKLKADKALIVPGPMAQ